MDEAEIELLASLEANHWWYAARRSFLRPRLRKSDGEVCALDVGAAGGGNTILLRDFGWDVTALEYSATGAAIARSKGLNVVRADSRWLPFSSESHSLATALDIIEHVKEDDLAMVELFRILEPRGRLVVTVPADPRLWSAHDVSQGHFRRYTRESLTDLTVRAGFHVNTLESWNVLLKPLVTLARLRKKDGSASDLAETKPIVNTILRNVLRVEQSVPILRRLPGVSLVMSAHRPGPNCCAGVSLAVRPRSH